MSKKTKIEYTGDLFEDLFEEAREQEEKDKANDSIYFDLTPYTFNMDIDSLIRRYSNNGIRIPSFQRDYVWSIDSASRFIDSLLRGLPSPSLFFYEEGRQEYLIIDGQQRVLTLYYYIEKGYFPTKKSFQNQIVNQSKKSEINTDLADLDDHHTEGQPFQLTGNVSQDWKNKSFSELTEEHQNILRNTYIYIIGLRQTSPAEDNSGMFLVFERINTGSTPLNAQEIRLCVSHGPFAHLLKGFAADTKWDNFHVSDKTSGISEIILRFFMFYYIEEYKGSLRSLLDKFIEKNKSFKVYSEYILNNLYNNSFDIMNKVFNHKDFISSESDKFQGYIFLAVWIGIAKNIQGKDNISIDIDKIKSIFIKLQKDKKYKDFVKNTRRAGTPSQYAPFLSFIQKSFENLIG